MNDPYPNIAITVYKLLFLALLIFGGYLIIGIEALYFSAFIVLAVFLCFGVIALFKFVFNSKRG